MRWDTKELFDSPELTRLLKAPIMAIFKALGVRNSDRPVAEPRPRPQCARFFLRLMAQTMNKYFTGDARQAELVVRANSHLWTGLLDEFAAAYHGAIYEAPNAELPEVSTLWRKRRSVCSAT